MSRPFSFAVIFSLMSSWIVKFLGLLSTIILARVLSPNDFGTAAIVMLALHFFDLFSTVGSKPYLLTLGDIKKNDLDSAFTLKLFLRLKVIILILGFSDEIALLLSIEGNEDLLRISTLVLLLNAFENPYLIVLAKNLEYSKIFKINIWTKFLSFCITIYLAFVLKSVWALIIGSIVSSFLTTLFSYIIVPYRPNIFFGKIYQQWSFTKWIYFGSFVNYSRSKADIFLISKGFSSEIVGFYTVAKELAMLVYEQFALPLNDIIIATAVKYSDNKNKFREIIYAANTSFSIIVVSICSILFIFSELIVTILLGPRWYPAVDIFQILILSTCFLSITAFNYAILNAVRKVKLRFYFDIINTILTIIILYLAYKKGITFFCFSVVITSFLYFVLTQFQIVYYLKLDFKRLYAISIKFSIPILVYLAISTVYGKELIYLKVLCSLLLIMAYVSLCVYFFIKSKTKNLEIFILKRSIKSLIKRINPYS